MDNTGGLLETSPTMLSLFHVYQQNVNYDSALNFKSRERLFDVLNTFLIAKEGEGDDRINPSDY